MLYIIARSYFLTEFLLENVEGQGDVAVIWLPRRPRDLIRSLLKPFDPFLAKWLGKSLIYESDFVERLKCIREDDSVLLFGVVNLKELKTIRQWIRARKVSLYLWNPLLSRNRSVKQRSGYAAALKQLADVCTFDPGDAQRFGFRLVPQVYRRFESSQESVVEPVFDVFFLGQDKGRLSQLLEFESLLHKNALTTKFHIVRDKGANYGEQDSLRIADQGISYKENIDLVRRSRCLLEITQKNQAGLTLRSLEAAFLRKKLITDNLGIIDTDLYDPERVFLIGRDDPEHLRDFVESPCSDVMSEILDKHDIRHWCLRFR